MQSPDVDFLESTHTSIQIVPKVSLWKHSDYYLLSSIHYLLYH